MSEEYIVNWSKWLHGLPMLEQISVARCFKPDEFDKVKSVKLHLFCDASSIGYGVAGLSGLR